jgi:hypothetical protein
MRCSRSSASADARSTRARSPLDTQKGVRRSQYCSIEYQAELRKHGILISMSGKGNCYDCESRCRPALPHRQIPAGVSGPGLRRPRRRTPVGGRVRALVQPRPPPQRHTLRCPGPAPRRPGRGPARRPPRAVWAGPRGHSAALERADAGLDASRRRDPHPGARDRGSSPAFPFDRRTRFPAPTCKRHGRGAQRRGWEERSRAQPPPGGEHGEAGEHRTFPAASTVARSAAVGGSSHRPRGHAAMRPE